MTYANELSREFTNDYLLGSALSPSAGVRWRSVDLVTSSVFVYRPAGGAGFCVGRRLRLGGKRLNHIVFWKCVSIAALRRDNSSDEPNHMILLLLF